MLRTLRVGVVLPLMIASALALSACTASTDDSPTAEPDVSTSASSEANPSSEAEPAEEGEIVASQEVTLVDGRGTALVEIEPLQVEGKVQTLTIHVTPELTDDADDLSLYELVGYTQFLPRLIDTENLKEYNSLEDENGDRLVSDLGDTRAKSGVTFTAWAFFAAPEDDVETLEVIVADTMPRFVGVTVEE